MPHWISQTARAEAQRAHEATLAAAAGNSETYYTCMAARLGVLFDVAQDRLERERADAQVLRGQLDAERARTAKAEREAAELQAKLGKLETKVGALRAQFCASGPALSAEFDGVIFEVKGQFYPEERGDLEEPGCSAYFEAEEIFLNGCECGHLLDTKVLESLEADCLAQCERNGREARAARRWPDLAGEVL